MLLQCNFVCSTFVSIAKCRLSAMRHVPKNRREKSAQKMTQRESTAAPFSFCRMPSAHLHSDCDCEPLSSVTWLMPHLECNPLKPTNLSMLAASQQNSPNRGTECMQWLACQACRFLWGTSCMPGSLRCVNGISKKLVH